MEPLVSVIIPTHNVEPYIAETLQSVLAQQGFRAFEVLIVDDRSTDKTLDAARQAAVGDPRVRFLQNTGKQGAAGARNFGLRHAAGAWVAFLDGDDLWEPDNLALKMAAAVAHPDEQMISSDFFNENRCNRTVPRAEWADIRQSLLPAWRKHLPEPAADASPVLRLTDLTRRFIEDDVLGNTGTFVIKRQAVMDLGCFDETLEVGEDVFLWIQLVERLGSMLFVHKPLMMYRYRPGSLTNQGYPAHAFFAERLFGVLARKAAFQRHRRVIRGRLSKALLQQSYYFRRRRQRGKALSTAARSVRWGPLNLEGWKNLAAVALLR